ncbi:RNA lariat debranching enzyme [Aspergillus clavatus NRRL 1]|uniref:RNA lariat debranching enzyme, putative n=1 Tax=Aspergillus clavatus (strain ATCC 1007 / CBS 513.65 / DSM 816 / NCTC 3887 / NRRL 1 / QM 1276 / 107) TaxID=344612 RepID=A1CTT4_ASPCL|nr:RNA lariat debranching enzyme, putative [Aspergillus clavatus NRRL 1]EAW06721.1 RNA lariat debranching enzyme, putative [Aspergillus clavatus NRRL 1]
MALSTPSSASFKVAFEGCGHGCLDDIYASVQKNAASKGWTGVDLVVIGGDFQAVRNSHDLTCMAVPQKYKEIGDFHDYYSGQKTAPYLTVFIGGNHEASNYLFELYYGGWVAPNIYYLGASNVIRCGPLRIAGLSGIWKGYDYRKPHFERLPYNKDDVQSVYHVRELDVRKLLQVRTQVDLGLSHDWPKQVELSGDYETLFRIKRGFRDDSNNGKLGNTAAKYVLDRLRPAFWFSAHLHVKFTAAIHHGDNGSSRPLTRGATYQNSPLQTSSSLKQFGMDGALVTSMIDEDEEKPAGQPDGPINSLDNTMPTAGNPKEDDISGHVANDNSTPENADTQTEVGNTARMSPLKRTRGDDQSRISAWNNFHAVASKNEAAENARRLAEPRDPSAPEVDYSVTWRQISVDEDQPLRKVTNVEQPVGDGGNPDAKKQKIEHQPMLVKNSDEIDLDLDSESDVEKSVKNENKIERQEASETTTTQTLPAGAISDSTNITEDQQKPNPEVESAVPEDIRNQLPASFARPQMPATKAPSVAHPVPEAISNKTTHFLALDKCQPHRHFLELLELPLVSDQTNVQHSRPFRLEYDKEWLAITRVFANELQLGNPSAPNAPDRGEVFYKPLIEEAEEWVEENIVKTGRITIPESFTPTAPFYDAAIPIHTDIMPPEYSNPQTAQFCELIGIENKFHLTEEERQARAQAGPRPSNPRFNNSNRRIPRRGGGDGHSGGGQWRGRGNGRGRGRGGGAPRW